MTISQSRKRGATRTMMVVAFRSFTDHTVVAKGRNLARVLGKARSAGVPDPVIHFEPPSGTRIIC